MRRRRLSISKCVLSKKSAVLIVVGPPTADGSRSKPTDSGARYGTALNLKNSMAVSTPEGEARYAARVVRSPDMAIALDSIREFIKGCIASPSLFNLFMDSCLYDLKECECGRRMDELCVKCLLYVDDQVILVLSVSELQEMVIKINESVKKRDRFGNSDVRERCSLKEDVVTKVEKDILRYFGGAFVNPERMNESRLTKQAQMRLMERSARVAL
ncbi:hypothetical protein EVAR_15809_1 [Eumeta japonica]|uniref:Reverse transcriptase domain-containing protein n=1 Tax=Eumeta variegata TaxID=151549 RepID=A0A4C1TZI1_EUMVA|nr:hypothetical protein EVAR_15809_1 [Eumeta japonica]